MNDVDVEGGKPSTSALAFMVMSSAGLTDEDRERIRNYLDKPPYQREPDDLLPGHRDDESTDSP